MTVPHDGGVFMWRYLSVWKPIERIHGEATENMTLGGLVVHLQSILFCVHRVIREYEQSLSREWERVPLNRGDNLMDLLLRQTLISSLV